MLIRRCLHFGQHPRRCGMQPGRGRTQTPPAAGFPPGAQGGKKGTSLALRWPAAPPRRCAPGSASSFSIQSKRVVSGPERNPGIGRGGTPPLPSGDSKRRQRASARRRGASRPRVRGPNPLCRCAGTLSLRRAGRQYGAVGGALGTSPLPCPFGAADSDLLQAIRRCSPCSGCWPQGRSIPRRQRRRGSPESRSPRADRRFRESLFLARPGDPRPKYPAAFCQKSRLRSLSFPPPGWNSAFSSSTMRPDQAAFLTPTAATGPWLLLSSFGAPGPAEPGPLRVDSGPLRAHTALQGSAWIRSPLQPGRILRQTTPPRARTAVWIHGRKSRLTCGEASGLSSAGSRKRASTSAGNPIGSAARCTRFRMNSTPG